MRKKHTKEKEGGSVGVADGLRSAFDSRIEVKEKVVMRLVELGYARSTIEASLTRLWEEGMDLDDVEMTLSKVKADLEKKIVAKSPAKEEKEETKKEEHVDQEEHRKDMRHRLECTAAIPSVLDVINGFRQWYSLVSRDDVLLCFPSHL